MDRDVTIRFYEITTLQDGISALEAVIRDISELPKVEREREVADGIVLRLENMRHQDGLVLGDLTRVQTENLPGHVTTDENDRLPVDRIGHPAAFCYDPETKCIALQFDLKIGIGRVCSYFTSFSEDSEFSHYPVLRPDALELFETETPKKFSFRVARIQNFEHSDRPLNDFESQIEAMGEMFGAPSVEVTVSCRVSDGGLNRPAVFDAIRRLLSRREELDGVTKISGATIESDEAYNFVKFLLKEKATLELPNNDPLDGRRVRFRHLRQTYANHREYFRGLAGLA